MSIFIRNTSLLLRTCKNIGLPIKNTPLIIRGYKSSLFLEDVEIKTKYEVTKDPNEWKYVERLIPPETVPELSPDRIYSSNYKPQKENLNNRPYFIKRTKNHMLPVYLNISYKGQKKLTTLKRIEGEIHLLSKQLEKFLQPMSKSPLRMQVHEFAGFICINGDYVNAIKHWLMKQGY